MKLVSIFLLCIAISSAAQELNSRVIVDAQQIETSERKVFEDMENEFEQFLNTTKWTDDTFAEEEVIDCNFLITISEMQGVGVFSATVQVLSSRPVYNSSYESLLLNFADRDWDFEYVKSQPLQFNENTFISNIVSLLSYYAYVIIGFDYDSFSELGGNPYFEKAFEIVNVAQNTAFEGWSQFNNVRNRYWLIENLRSPQLEPVRLALYKYHRKGLDTSTEDKEASEKIILECLSDIQKANRAKPRSILVIAFMDSKADELIQIFRDSDLPTRRQAYNLLNNIDPARSDQFKALIN